jgi:hypothetical protein
MPIPFGTLQIGACDGIYSHQPSPLAQIDFEELNNRNCRNAANKWQIEIARPSNSFK